MITLTKWMLAPALAAAFLFAADTTSAQAQGFHMSLGGGSCGGYGGGFYAPTRSHFGYGAAFSSGRYHSFYGHRGPRYHDTSHYDWHPTEIRRHGNHFDVIPGHYDFHRTGHWHH
ncbi:MAG: hypothetical protein HKN47_19035 [Pirellulaceae bacterium]|nr:hypothetical protein [Pirellulaceae bacterium]